MSEVGVLMFGVFYGPESQQRRRKSQCFEQTNEESTKFEFHQPTSAPMQSLFYKTFLWANDLHDHDLNGTAHLCVVLT
jgi:hypothetical protein